MERHKITREEAEEAAEKYGMKIDPVQFEPKKRGRPAHPSHMVTPPQELPEVPEPEAEPAPEPPAPEAEPEAPPDAEPPAPEPEPAPEPDAEPPAPEAETEPAPEPEAPAPEPEPAKAAKEDGELEEEEVEEEETETYTAKYIEDLVIADLRKLAESHGIATTENGKKIAPKALRVIVMSKLRELKRFRD
jgi:hypothetical protein